jgi:hypothetical protein
MSEADEKYVLDANVCHAFDVECISPFEMLRRLGVQLDWIPPR